MNKELIEKELDIKINKTVDLTEGFSVDKKYIVNDEYVVRVLKLDRYDRFKFNFEVQEKFFDIGKCQKPIALLKDEDFAYFITDYLPGENGLVMINNFSNKKQYELGVEAGKYLATFHINNFDDNYDIKEYYEYYIGEKIKSARKDNLVQYIPMINEIIDFVTLNKHILYDSKATLCHSDYHLFNMIFDDSGYNGIIDFERSRIGHPISDFRSNTPFNVTKSVYFAKGLVDGYLSINLIDNFWELYNLYDAIMSIGGLSWHLIFDKDNVLNMAKQMISTYENTNGYKDIPKWYSNTVILK